MIPVAGDSSALVQTRFGSSATASAAVSTRIPSTPLASARCLIPASIASSWAFVATINLPQFTCGTPFSAQYGYSARRPATQNRAMRDPAG